MAIDYLIKNREKSENKLKDRFYQIIPVPNQYFIEDILNKKTDQKLPINYKQTYTGLKAYNPYAIPDLLNGNELDLNLTKKPQKEIYHLHKPKKNQWFSLASKLEEMTLIAYLRPTPGAVQEERHDRDFSTTAEEEKKKKIIELLLYKKKEIQQIYAKKEETKQGSGKSYSTQASNKMMYKYLN